MNDLIIANAYPVPSRNFRFLNFIGMITQKHIVFFVALGENRKAQEIGHDLMVHYRKVLAEAGPEVELRIVENMPTEELM